MVWDSYRPLRTHQSNNNQSEFAIFSIPTDQQNILFYHVIIGIIIST